MRNLVLDDAEGEALDFLLGVTIEQWDAVHWSQVGRIADDPGFDSLEEQLAVAALLSDLEAAIKRVRVKLRR
jgi:hypothetical protein